MLDAIDRRLRRAQCFHDGRVLYLTTTDSTDDELVRFFETRGWEYLRGDVDDVFSRFRKACSERGPESFFRVCADNPFLDPTLMDQLAKAYRVAGKEIPFDSRIASWATRGMVTEPVFGNPPSVCSPEG